MIYHRLVISDLDSDAWHALIGFFLFCFIKRMKLKQSACCRGLVMTAESLSTISPRSHPKFRIPINWLFFFFCKQRTKFLPTVVSMKWIGSYNVVFVLLSLRKMLYSIKLLFNLQILKF